MLFTWFISNKSLFDDRGVTWALGSLGEEAVVISDLKRLSPAWERDTDKAIRLEYPVSRSLWIQAFGLFN